MPTYEYRCAKCGEHLEAFQTFSEAPLIRHESCGGKLSKVMSAAGVILKGSGFYKTDSRTGARKDAKKEKRESSALESSSSSSSNSSSSSDSSSSSSSTKSDSKPAAKTA